MRILEFKLQHKLSNTVRNVISQDSGVHIIYSADNSTGKTTLMRAIFYSLGFNIPDTELVKFSDFEFCIKVIVKESVFNVVRKNNLITVNGVEFDLPTDELAVRSLLFDVTNYDLLNNFLGTMYFDQEKGWTLLNRGTIIGGNRFTVENFFRGLKDTVNDESYKLEAELRAINKKIAQYNLMYNVAEYQAEVNQNINQSLTYNTFDEEVENELIQIRQQLNIIENDLKIINDIIKKNKNFVDFIEQKKIFVKMQDDSIVQVTRHNLYNYDSVFDSNDARKSMLVAERNLLKHRIAELESAREKQLTLETLPSVEEQLVQQLSKIKTIGTVEVKSILDRLKKEKERLSKLLLEHTKNNNLWIAEVYETAQRYATELKIPNKVKIDIFTHNLKSKSGAILHKLVFIFKMAFIKALSKKIGYPIPIFCDSPNGREVEHSTIRKILAIIKRDFSDHQLFIASIFDYKEIFPNANIIQLNGKLFDQDNLFNYINND